MNQAEQFDFDQEVEPTKWLVQDLIPLGQLIFCLARAGQGKSYFAEALAIKMVYGEQFLDRYTKAGDVLIIDQDTPQDLIDKRLITLGLRYDAKPKHKLFLKSHEGLSMSNKSLLGAISDHPSASLIILDSWHSILGDMNPNGTSDINHACAQLKRFLNPHRTIWVNHHISEKKLMSIQDLMFGSDIGSLFMGNSTIVQQLDTAFIVNGMSNNGVLHEMYVRPWGKRAYISQGPFLASFNDSEFAFEGDLENMKGQDECVCDLRILFAESPEKGFAVEDSYKAMGQKHGWNKLREALAYMETTGEARMERGTSNRFKYFPTDMTRKPRVIIGTMWVSEKAEREKDKEKTEGEEQENVTYK